MFLCIYKTFSNLAKNEKKKEKKKRKEQNISLFYNRNHKNLPEKI